MEIKVRIYIIYIIYEGVLSLCSVNCYLMYVLSSIRHEIDVHGITFNMCTASELDEFGYYNYEAGCGYVFSTKTAQNRYA